ncbi:MAG: glycosyltransferase [Phycisphaeraceae bacterium]|nr:glycosyltransferase [Phycisphaerales bacterium]MCB9859081.1 glycosyltransferase [Phycisphaeraceae bacterium]
MSSPNGHISHQDARPTWPRTDTPLRIAILGWARLSMQVREGSGYNLSASELASGLSMSGHTVVGLSCGMRYSPIPGIRIRHLETWRNIECYDIINSPCHSPAAMNFRNMPRELHSPTLTQRIIRWLDEHRIQIVHIHSLEGYSLDLISAIRATDRHVVCTLHNYWFVCPQVDLLWNETHVCDNYEGGDRCVNCLPRSPSYAKQRFKRAAGRALDRVLGPNPANIIRGTAYSLADRVRNKHSKDTELAGNDEPLADPELALGFNVARNTNRDVIIQHGLALHSHEQTPELGVAPIDQNERMLAPDNNSNGDRHLVVLNEYGKRRHAGADALNHASLVTPPSRFVADVHARMGVDKDKLRVVRLGQPHFDQINRHARRHRLYEHRPWDASHPDRPLRFGFFGTTRNNKGLDVLVRAIPLLSPEVRQKCQFLIRASGWDWPFRKRLSVYPEVQFAGGYDMLQLIAAWGEYDIGVLSHVWFENSPLVLLEHLHAGKFVISSRLGGPVEWLKEPEHHAHYNGLMFAGGDPHGLAQCITRCVTGDVVVPSPKEIHDATPILQSYPDHVREVESIYREFLGDMPVKHTNAQHPEIEVKADHSVLQAQ